MFRSHVCRLTACLVLAALLGLAVPASAAPPGWFPSSGMQGPGWWLNQVIERMGRLFLGEKQGSGDLHKGDSAQGRVQPQEPESDATAVIDPNGSC